MLYRVRINLAFDEEALARSIYEQSEKVLNKSKKIAPNDESAGEISFIEIHKCYHDEIRSKPCEIIKRIEV